MKAMIIALECVRDKNLRIKSALSICSNITQAINGDGCDNVWRSSQWIAMLQQLLLNAGSPSMVLISREWNQIVIKLDRPGNNSHSLSLFHQGMDLPRWLMANEID